MEETLVLEMILQPDQICTFTPSTAVMRASKHCKIIKPVPDAEWEYPKRMPEYWVEFTDGTPDFKAYAVELTPIEC